MNERKIEHLKTHEGRNNIANVSPTFVGGTSFSMVVFEAMPPIYFQPVAATKLEEKNKGYTNTYGCIGRKHVVGLSYCQHHPLV